MTIQEFKGIGILLFYSNGLFQGHLIKDKKEATFSLAGTHLKDHKDPHQNDCLEPNDFYNVLFQSTTQQFHLLVRREKNNDASNLFTDVLDDENPYHFHFQTNQFLSGQKARLIKDKYFINSLPQFNHDHDLFVCIGDVVLQLK